jgi:hypothetical protein
MTVNNIDVIKKGLENKFYITVCKNNSSYITLCSFDAGTTACFDKNFEWVMNKIIACIEDGKVIDFHKIEYEMI